MIKTLENQVTMQFGTGDIGVNPCYEKDGKTGALIFYNQTSREIGSEGDVKAGAKIDINDFPVVMVFNKKESIDVLINALNEVKNLMP